VVELFDLHLFAMHIDTFSVFHISSLIIFGYICWKETKESGFVGEKYDKKNLRITLLN